MLRRGRYPLFLAVAALALVAFPAVTQAGKNCKDLLNGNTYTCDAVSRPGEQFGLRLDFSGPESGPEFGVLIDQFTFGICACKAKKPNVKRPDKIRFDAAKEFHCLVPGGPDSLTGGRISGPDFGGPESFLVDFASYEGKVTKKGIKKGQAVDALGTPIVYGCQRLPEK